MDTPQANVARADKLIKTGSNVFKVNREHDDGIVREVCCITTPLVCLSCNLYKVLAWFTQLIGDQDVVSSRRFMLHSLLL